MKRIHWKRLIAVLLMTSIFPWGGVSMAESLHYYPNENVGDVHPFYNAAEDSWYMFYLRPNGFQATLLCSKDMIHWTPKDITCTSGQLAAYYVLGVLQAGEKYYSWYGSGTSMSASESDDLLTWHNPGNEYAIPMGYTTFIGQRDPYVFWDPDEQVYRVICTAYRTNQLQGRGLGMKCALGIASTKSDQLNAWNPIDTALIDYPDGLNGEPECPQMLKIGNRWYVFVSLARRHENHVGRLSYYIGDEGKGIFEQDWNEKEEHVLTSEDVCAAQVAQGPDGYYLWGWIAENWNGGSWGGHLSIPLKISQQPDGTLTTSIAPAVATMISEEPVATGQDKVQGDFSRWHAQATFFLEAGKRITFHCGNGQIVLDDATGLFAVFQNDSLMHVSYQLTPGSLAGTHEMQVIGEENILEVFLDDQWSLAARMQESTQCEQMMLEGGQTTLITVRNLK